MDYYNELHHIIVLMLKRYNPQFRKYNTNNYNFHICALFNDNTSEIIMGECSEQRIGNIPYLSTHAEMSVLYKAREYLNSNLKLKTTKSKSNTFDMLVIRVNKNSKLGNSKPCQHCIHSFKRANYIHIRNVYYSTSMGTIHKDSFSYLDMNKCNSDIVYMSMATYRSKYGVWK